MAKRYCKICGAEWDENFDECWNCGMPADPDEQLWFDKDARRRLERKKRINRKKSVRKISRLNRGLWLPLILGTAAVLHIVIAGGFSPKTLTVDVIGLLLFTASLGYIIKTKFFN